MGTITIQGTAKDNIIAWTGAWDAIPKGWKICDGTLGTPDLRAEFTMSVPNISTDPATGDGSDTHTLVTAELDLHSHPIVDGAHQHPWGTVSSLHQSGGNSHRHSTTSTLAGVTIGNAGSGDSHENRPAYFELVFIQRI